MMTTNRFCWRWQPCALTGAIHQHVLPTMSSIDLRPSSLPSGNFLRPCVNHSPGSFEIDLPRRCMEDPHMHPVLYDAHEHHLFLHNYNPETLKNLKSVLGHCSKSYVLNFSHWFLPQSKSLVSKCNVQLRAKDLPLDGFWHGMEE